VTDDSSFSIGSPETVRASLAIFARVPYQGIPVSVYDGIIDVYSDSDTIQGWNRENIGTARTFPMKYMEQARFRLADLGARILALITFIDAAMAPKGPLIPPGNDSIPPPPPSNPKQ